MESMDESAYRPDSFKLLSPKTKSCFLSQLRRAIFFIPGIVFLISAAMGIGQSPMVGFSPTVVCLTANIEFLFLKLWLKDSSCSTHKKIREAQAIPVAKPKILRRLNVLFLQIFRNNKSSWFCSMVTGLYC